MTRRSTAGPIPRLAPLGAVLLCALVLTCPRNSDAQVTLDVSYPRSLEPWQAAPLVATIRNNGWRPIQLLELEIKSPSGLVARYGYRGPNFRWVGSARGNRRSSGYVILLERMLQQVLRPGQRPPRPATNTQLALLHPLFPGQSQRLVQSVRATYAQRGHVSVELTYVVLDAQRMGICATSTQRRTGQGFVPCRHVRRVTENGPGFLYVERSQLERDQRRIGRTALFLVRRPAFDLAQARFRGRVTKGPVAYDRAEKRWLLVDERLKRTVFVPARGHLTFARGNWLNLVLELGSQKTTTVLWDAPSERRAAALMRTLQKAGFQPNFMQHKGYRSKTAFFVVVTRPLLPQLVRLVADENATLNGGRISHPSPMLGLPAPPKGCLAPSASVKRFCDGRVYPQGQRGHIHWVAYYSMLSKEALSRHYRKVCGKGNLDASGSGYVWRFPTRNPTAVLSIGPATEKGPWYQCKLPKGARSILSISHFPR